VFKHIEERNVLYLQRPRTLYRHSVTVEESREQVFKCIILLLYVSFRGIVLMDCVFLCLSVSHDVWKMVVNTKWLD
jgi:hypothetical protein